MRASGSLFDRMIQEKYLLVSFCSQVSIGDDKQSAPSAPNLVEHSGNNKADRNIPEDQRKMVPNKRIHYADEEFDPKQVDVLMAGELNKLSFNCREKINEEIHGVCSLAIEETPGMVAMALDNLAIAIEKIPNGDKQAYLQSLELYPNNRYVNDRNFRLMFLRCELFDIERAAKRLVRHLDFVLEIFNNNTELLQRPIRLNDLAARSMKLLRSGCLQLLPVRDSSGRRVFAVTTFKSHYEVIDRVSFCRPVFQLYANML